MEMATSVVADARTRSVLGINFRAWELFEAQGTPVNDRGAPIPIVRSEATSCWGRFCHRKSGVSMLASVIPLLFWLKGLRQPDCGCRLRAFPRIPHRNRFHRGCSTVGRPELRPFHI